MATTRIMSLRVGKGRTESLAISDLIDYVANPRKQLKSSFELLQKYGICFIYRRNIQCIIEKEEMIVSFDKKVESAQTRI